MPRVNIPGVGAVNFPDTMTPEQITQAIETDILPKAQGAAQTQPAAPAPEASSGSPTGAPPLARAARLLLAPIGEAVSALDQFTGVPIRAGINEIQNRQEARGEGTDLGSLVMGPLSENYNPLNNLKDVAAGIGAAAKNFGGRFQGFSDENVPEAKQIAARAGVPTTALSEKIPGMYSETGEGAALKKGGFFDPTAAGVAGAGLDMVTPLPGLGAAKMGAKAVGNASRMAAKGTAAGVKGAAKGAAKAVDVATGTKAGTKSLEAVGDALQSTVDATKAVGKGIAKKYEGKYAEKYVAKHTKTAAANGIDPELIPNSVKFGENSQASKYQRYEAEFLRPELADAHDKGLRQVQDAVRKDIEKIGNKSLTAKAATKIPQDAAEAGEILRGGFNRKVDEFFDKTDVRYKTIAQKYPNITIPPETQKRLAANLAKQEAKANDLLKNSYDNASKAQAREFLEAVQQAKGATNSYADLVTALQGIGRTAFKNTPPGGITPPDKALFRAMYKDLSGVAMETVSRRVGKKTAQELAENNKLISEFINDKSVLSVLANPKISPQKAFKTLIEDGDSFKIKALKRALSKDEMQAVKAGFLKEQIRAISATDGEFTFRMLNNRLRSKRGAVDALFDKGELDNLRNLVELGDDFGPKVLSTSGTGASNQAQALVDRASEGVVKNATRAAVMGANKGLAKRQERKAAEAFAKSKAPKGGDIVAGPPGMNINATGIAPKRMADLLRLKPRLQGQAAAYKNLNEEEDQ